MPRNSTGTYTLPEAPVVADTVIDPDWANSTLDDLKAEMTDSLSRTGNGGMLAHMRGIDGSAALPAYAFSDQNTLGSYRAGSGDYRVAFNGTDIFKFTTSEARSYSALKVSSGGCTIDAGGLTVTAGGATITAGGLSATGTTPSAGGVTGANSLIASGALADTNSTNYALTTLAQATTPGPNTVRLNARAVNDASGTIASWADVGIGLSYDVDSDVGSGGSLYFHETEGVKITGGTTATATDPANALELTNGNLKLSGTAPNSDEALANTLTPANICKAHASVVITNGVLGTPAGFNIASVSFQAFTGTVDMVRFTFAQPFTDTTYTCIPSVQSSNTPIYRSASFVTKATTHVDVVVVALTSAPAISGVDASDSSTSVTLDVVCFGLN